VAAAAAGIAVDFYDGVDGIGEFFDALGAGSTNPAIIWLAGIIVAGGSRHRSQSPDRWRGEVCPTRAGCRS
jgi:hypothetical protein